MADAAAPQLPDRAAKTACQDRIDRLWVCVERYDGTCNVHGFKTEALAVELKDSLRKGWLGSFLPMKPEEDEPVSDFLFEQSVQVYVMDIAVKASGGELFSIRI